MAIIKRKYLVSIKDVGTSNLITNRGFLRLLEDIACVHSDIAGYGINQMSQTHLSWVLLHWKVRILKRVSYNSTITIHTWSRNSNKFTTYRDFEMYDENDNLICIASTKWTLVSSETGRIAKITPEIIECYTPEDNKNVFGELDIAKLQEPENIDNPSYTFTVQRRDIDINHHMNNLFYFDYAIEALPQEVYENLNCNEFEIMYKNGAKLGNTVNCFYANEHNSHYVVMKSAEDNRLHAIVKFH